MRKTKIAALLLFFILYCSAGAKGCGGLPLVCEQRLFQLHVDVPPRRLKRRIVVSIQNLRKIRPFS